MVYWVNVSSNDKRIFTYVHLRKAPCNEMQKATARSVHKSCLSKNDMDRTHSKPWRSERRSSVKTPKQHRIAGKLNGPQECVFFYVLIHQFPELIQSVPSLAPGVEQFLAAVDVAVSSWKPMCVVYAMLCPKFEGALTISYTLQWICAEVVSFWMYSTWGTSARLPRTTRRFNACLMMLE